jgi:hypothetical protein
MSRATILSLAAVTVASLCAASAAALGGIAGGQVSAGDAPITACDTGFTLVYTTLGGDVTAVTVNGIADPACEGADLSVTLTDAGGGAVASGGPASVPTDGDAADNSLVLPVSPNPAAEQVAGYHVSLVGP